MRALRWGFLLAVAWGAAAAPAAEAKSALHVIPFPGTPDASSASQVIFSALRPSDLRGVTVIGSRSGQHAGRLEPLPAGAGTAFVPDRQFVPGETVRVLADLTSPRAGTASGDPGATRLSFAFGVAAPLSAPVGSQTRSWPAGQSWSWPASQNSGWLSSSAHGPTQHFRSVPDLRPPVVSTSSNGDRESGDIFLAPQYSPQVGPMILDSQGQLVWFHPLRKGSQTYYAANLAVQRYRGHDVLTWWQGEQLGTATDVIMDSSYRPIAVVHAGEGYQPDLHEFQITPQGTALIDILALTSGNLTSVGGPAKGGVLDDIIQEVDIRTGQVLWEWHSVGHIPLSASYETYSPGEYWYDYLHLNSIQQLPNGNLLISGRNTWAVYEISRRTGDVIWTLGGKYSSFRMGSGTAFEWQHDARLRPGRILSVFDDAADGTSQEEGQSSAKLLRIDPPRRTVSLVRRFRHFPPLLTTAAGNAQTLPNGDLFVGWGEQPVFSEYSPSGRQIFSGNLPLGVGSYRAFRFPWVGQPVSRPSLAVSAGHAGHMTVYASWNGATQVVAWRVLGGSSPRALKPLGITAARSGFETSIEVRSGPRYFAVQALARDRKVLSTSAPARV